MIVWILLILSDPIIVNAGRTVIKVDNISTYEECKSAGERMVNYLNRQTKGTYKPKNTFNCFKVKKIAEKS